MPAATSLHIDLYNYWNAVRGSRPTPTRADIDPVDIVSLLPFIALIERDRETYFWRLIGTSIVEHFGRDLTGEPYGAHFSPVAFVAETKATFDAALASGTPFFDEFVYRSSRGTVHAVCRLVCPLAPGKSHPPMVIHTRIHRFAHKLVWSSPLVDEAWGSLRNRQPISSVGQLQRLADEWSNQNLSNE